MAVEPQDTPGWKFFQNHIKYFYEKDIDGLLANDYHQDAKLIAFVFPPMQGHDALRQVFTEYLNMIGDFKITSMDNFTETDDVIFLEATMETEKAGERKVYDIFMMKEGKITHHITGVK